MSMDFITYAQNAEDVMLWRALREIERGFYIDVGAQDPIVDSVTKAFYERGWHGINIEPVEHWYERLVHDRPHDINLRLAASDHSGEMNLFEIEATGLSTSNPAFAATYEGRGVHEVVVRCRRLDDICAEHHVSQVHFLKIDCEGGEKQAIEGLSLKSVRPWIILVEATEPNSLKPAYGHWEPLLLQRGYKFVYFDGLNRFYVAEEHAELENAFGSPPNPIEWAERAPVVFAHQRAQQLAERLAQASSVERAVRAEIECDHWRQENVRREQALVEMRHAVISFQQQSSNLSNETVRLQSEVGSLIGRLGLAEREKQDLLAQLAARTTRAGELEIEIIRIREELARMLASHSWKLTRPLRVARRALAALRRDLRHVGKTVMRPVFRAVRPALRNLSRNEVARKLATGVMGRDSAVIRRARLFLFGTVTSPSGNDVARGGPAERARRHEVSGHSARERTVMAAMRDALTRSREGK